MQIKWGLMYFISAGPPFPSLTLASMGYFFIAPLSPCLCPDCDFVEYLCSSFLPRTTAADPNQ